MRYTGNFDPAYAQSISLREYSIIERAVQLRNIDREYDMAKLAYMTEAMRCVDEKGEHLYSSLSDLYNYDKEIAQIVNKGKAPEKARKNPLLQITKRFNNRQNKKGG